MQMRPGIINSRTYNTPQQLCFIWSSQELTISWSVSMNCRPTWIYIAHSTLLLKNQLLQNFILSYELTCITLPEASVHSSDHDAFYCKNVTRHEMQDILELECNSGLLGGRYSPSFEFAGVRRLAYILRCRDAPDAAVCLLEITRTYLNKLHCYWLTR